MMNEAARIPPREALLAELEERVENKDGAVEGERFRIYWEGMPIWGRLRAHSELFASLQTCVLASTYCNSWIFSAFDPEDPYTSMARAYTELFIVRSDESKEALGRLIKLVGASRGNVHVDTMVSPSYTSAFTQLIQLPSSSGMENNLVVFDYEKSDPAGLVPAVEHLQLAAATGFDVIILGLSARGFGAQHEIHLWLPPGDYGSANLMVLIAYILGNDPDWRNAEVKVFDVVSEEERSERRSELRELVRAGRLPISERNVEVIVPQNGSDRSQLVSERSRDADFTLIGLRRESVRRLGTDAFAGYDEIGNVGFVIGVTDVEIERDEPPADTEPEEGSTAGGDSSCTVDRATPTGSAWCWRARCHCR